MSEINTSNISENQFFHQLVELNKTINKLTIQYEKSQEENEANRKLIKSLTEQLDQANATILDLSAQIRLMAAQKYGRSSEKRKPDKRTIMTSHPVLLPKPLLPELPQGNGLFVPKPVSRRNLWKILLKR